MRWMLSKTIVFSLLLAAAGLLTFSHGVSLSNNLFRPGDLASGLFLVVFGVFLILAGFLMLLSRFARRPQLSMHY